jgi:paired amphipathic helix protein Sin3a
MEVIPVVPSLVPPIPVPLEAGPQPTAEDITMYERIKKIIGSKTTLTEFVKLLNCYNQELGSPGWILMKSREYVDNDTPVMNWLAALLNSDRNVENLLKQLDDKPDLAKCRAFGLSYRCLPEQDRVARCSGRDELCREVLNDVWASHPTWDSEETGFVAHKKTTYEENLHRIEEERHDYDSNIECLVRTIQLLEPICRTLQTHPDPRSFKTDVKLGGQSEFIYKRIVYKLYGRYDGADVVNMLQIKPYLVAPILLHRLKDTREKWKAAQRQWYEVWRHQTAANFHRSLDVQGSIKSGDKRMFQSKQLQQEIRVKREEQRNKAIRSGQPAFLANQDELLRKDYQYAYRFSNEEVLYDTCRLVLAEFNGRRNNPQESQLLFARVKELLALFLSMDVSVFRDYVEDWSDMSAVEKNTGKPKSMLHAVLDRKLGDVTPATGANTPMGNSGLDDDYATPLDEADESPMQSWFKLQPMRIGQPATPAGESDAGQAAEGAEREISPDEMIERTEYHLYCNNTIYNFFRLFGMLYDRLELLYNQEKEVRQLVDVQKMRKPAHDLHLLDNPNKDNLFFDDVSPTASFYAQTVSKFEDYIYVQEGSLQSHIEDVLRRYYLPFGWQMYHLERLLNQMEKMAIGMLMSDKERLSEQLIQLWKKDRVKERASLMEDLSYKKQAFRYLGTKEKDGETSYRITYVSLVDATSSSATFASSCIDG